MPPATPGHGWPVFVEEVVVRFPPRAAVLPARHPMLTNPLTATTMDKHSTVPDIVLKAEEIQWVDFSLPGWTGKTTAAFANMDVEKAPFIAMVN